jgi:hypothetical protein
LARLDYGWFVGKTVGRTLSDPEGIVTIGAIQGRLTWKELHLVAMLEPDSNKSPSLLDDAINAVLDQIEELVPIASLKS